MKLLGLLIFFLLVLYTIFELWSLLFKVILLILKKRLQIFFESFLTLSLSLSLCLLSFILITISLFLIKHIDNILHHLLIYHLPNKSFINSILKLIPLFFSLYIFIIKLDNIQAIIEDNKPNIVICWFDIIEH